jgi:hypothetical protein
VKASPVDFLPSGLAIAEVAAIGFAAIRFLVAPFTRIAPDEVRGGLPARKIKMLEATDDRG